MTLNEKDKQDLIGNILNWIYNFYKNPHTFLNVLIFIIIFYCFIYLCGVPMTIETRPSSIYFIEKIIWIIFITVIIVDFFVYILGIPLIDMIFGLNGELINNWYKLQPNIQPNKPVVNEIKISKKPEVFNISNNLYTYGDAQSVCNAFGARLATVDELHEAYDDGAEWCVNSWSANQQALFPTQKSTFNKLQNIKGSENICGRTGVNGGRMENTSLKLGVNCYGIKPEPNENDKTKMNSIKEFVPPKTKEDMILDAKVEFWKKNKDKYAVLSPFNSNKWSDS